MGEIEPGFIGEVTGLIDPPNLFSFQAAVSKRTTAAAIAGAGGPWCRNPGFIENVPQARFKIAIAGQKVFS
jgi:hypothetical protein